MPTQGSGPVQRGGLAVVAYIDVGAGLDELAHDGRGDSAC